MKLLVSVSLAALALTGVAATPAIAQTAVPTASATPTAAEADAFIAAVEKDLFAYSVEASQVNWVNSTYITEDTDALAAKINAVGTEKSVKYALEAANMRALGPERRHQAQARHPSHRHRPSCADHAWRRDPCQRHPDEAAVGLWQGQGDAERRADFGQRH